MPSPLDLVGGVSQQLAVAPWVLGGAAMLGMASIVSLLFVHHLEPAVIEDRHEPVEALAAPLHGALEPVTPLGAPLPREPALAAGRVPDDLDRVHDDLDHLPDDLDRVHDDLDDVA